MLGEEIVLRSLLLRLFDHHTLYMIRMDLYFLRVRLKNRLKSNIVPVAKKNAKFLNVACGPHGISSEDWVNIDGWKEKSIDVVCDLRRRLPFEDCRFEGVFAEHFFEHLRLGQAEEFINECIRVLKPNGVLRLSVPNGELYLRNYLENREWMLERRGGIFSTPMDVVNAVFRQHYEHQYCYDFESLSSFLSKFAFESVERCEFGFGSRKELLIDQASRKFESLYVEATKRS